MKKRSEIIVEWEITLLCNYSCFYCTNLDPSIKPVLEESRIDQFIKFLGEEYPGTEIFVFGGEPFIHPKIEFIIKTFNKYNVPFVIQTNCSKKSISVMKKITDPYMVQISVHPTQISLENLSIPSDVNIRVIDVMYTGKEAIDYYMKVKNKAPNVYLTPVADFGDGKSTTSLREYNRLKNSKAWNKIIKFENVKRLGDDRSKLWEDYSPQGKPCHYIDTYFLYSPNLDLFNCCYRENHNGICNHDKCFLM